MDIMELGAIGELVGGVAVIGSLIFVGLQLRQSNRLNEAEALRNYTREYNHSVLSPLMDIETADLVRRGLNEFEQLDKAQKIAVHAMWTEIVLLGQSNFILRRSGLMRGDFASTAEAADIAMLKAPGAASWWATVRPLLVPEYVEHVDRLLESEGAAMTAVLPWWGPDDIHRQET